MPLQETCQVRNIYQTNCVPDGTLHLVSIRVLPISYPHRDNQTVPSFYMEDKSNFTICKVFSC